MADDTVNKADARQAAVSAQVRSPELPRETGPVATGATWGNIPVLSSGMTFSEVGSSGLRQFSGWVREEFLAQLIGRQGAQKYREMKDNSPTIGGMLFSINAMMRKVEWRITPPDDTPNSAEAVDFVEGLKDDMSHTWEDLISENLTMLPFGYAPHEIVYKRRLGRDPGPDPDRPGHDLPQSRFDDGKIGWRRLPLRAQETVLKWFFDENGQVKGVTQQPWIGPLIDLPIEKLLLFRADPHKGNPEGRSILRQSYVPYYYAKRMQEQEAILAERMGGVPVLKLPGTLLEGASSGDAGALAALNEYKRIVTNLRIDEQMGVIIPSDLYPTTTGGAGAEQYKFELITPGHGGARGGGMDFDKTITRYKVDMMTSVLADFLQLGHEARGTQSLAVSKVDMFLQAVEGFLNSIAGVYNRYGLPRLWKLNGMDEDTMPRFEPDLAQRVDLDVLSNFVLRMAQAGMPMFPNEELQSYILDAAGMPDVIDDRALQATGLLDAQLDVKDEKEQVALEQMKNPPEPKTPLQKMIAASIARRLIRHSGPKFGVRTKKRMGHVHRRR